MSNYNYYESELEKVPLNPDSVNSIVISNFQGEKTKYLNLNQESIPRIIEYLKKAIIKK